MAVTSRRTSTGEGDQVGPLGGAGRTSSSSLTSPQVTDPGLGRALSFGRLIEALGRKKPLDGRTYTNLNRCLNLLDLTALGVGSTLGLGLYVLAGQVASNKAGPAVVVSFALAALASAFSALCYAEFAGRVPRAGSAYAYSYITIGELVAFIIGWNLILEYVIGASSVARGFSGYLRFVYDHVTAQDLFGSPQTHGHGRHLQPLELTSNGSQINSTAAGLSLLSASSSGLSNDLVGYLVKHFDWPSVVIIIILTIFILFGVKESTNVTLAFTAVNLIVVISVVVSSISSLDLHHWRLAKEEVPQGFGEGGFMPYGWSGVLAGSATCFFGFIGFDTIASSAEEAKNPKRNVPLSIILSLFISFVAYMAIAIVQTLLWPYYDQNQITILPHIFNKLEMPIIYWVVLLGAIAGLASSQLGGMYPLPRILYSMAQDRLIYGYLAHVNRRLKLPVRATIMGSVSIAILACLLDIQDLADMVSIGTLAAYSLVSVSVLIIRYEDREDAIEDDESARLSLADVLNVQAVGEAMGELSKSHFRKPLEELKSDPDCCHVEPTSEKRTPPSRKPSIGISAKGSRAVTAQLSAGFNSWFKFDRPMSGFDSAPAANPANATDGAERYQPVDPRPGNKINNRPRMIDLLINWRLDDDLRSGRPDGETSRQSKILISLIVILTILLDIVALCLATSSGGAIGEDGQQSGEQQQQQQQHYLVRLMAGQQYLNPRAVLTSMGSILLVGLAAVVLILSRLPTSGSAKEEVFQVPLLPITPTLSILVNTFLMLNLSYLTWIRFLIWMTLGLFIYFTYGIWNSRGHLLHMNK